MIYKYNDQYYFTDYDLDNAIINEYDEHENNADPSDYIDFDTIMMYDVEYADKNDFSVFKAWCKQEGLVAGRCDSLEQYMKEVKE